MSITEAFLMTLFMGVFLVSILLIAYYTSKIRKLEKNEKYAGFMVEVLLKGSINNDILPIHIFSKEKSTNDSVNPLYKYRNYWVLIFWMNILLLFILFIIEKYFRLI